MIRLPGPPLTRYAMPYSVARTCNLIFIVLDVLKPLNDLKVLTNELEGVGIRLNKKPPNITIKQRERGGVSLLRPPPIVTRVADSLLPDL
jgi:ribosome-interacting GTPase 1